MDRGIFPGPSESEEDFLLRAEALKSLDSSPPVLIQRTFNVAPDWIEVVTASKGLYFWEGAATWIEENSEGKRWCKIQYKDTFLTRFYPKDEVIAHEMVHAMRLMFDEPRFEEILAYQTSQSRFRRYFGPLFSHPGESKLFLGSVVLSWILYWAELLFDVSFRGGWILLLPLFVLGFGVFRLFRSQSIFAQALRRLKMAAQKDVNPLAIALRLTDAEVEQCAQWTPEEIRTFAAQENNLRWRQIHTMFF